MQGLWLWDLTFRIYLKHYFQMYIFVPLLFKVENLNIMVFSISVSKNPDWNYAGEGYKSSFIHHDYNHSRSLFFKNLTMIKQLLEFIKNFKKYA
jgi:hypothetical protein